MRVARFAAEHDEQFAPHVKRRQPRRRHAENKQRHVLFVREQQNPVLAPEPAQRRHTAQREHADEKCPKCNRRLAPQPAHLPNILLVMHRHDDAARAEKQQRLEKRVRRQVEGRLFGSAQPHRHHHVTELRERGIREDAFDVVLRNGNHRRHHRRDAANPRNNFQRLRTRQQQERNATQHINARRHHRRRVNQRRNRRRPFHRVGQPDMQRKLRALSDRAAENQQGNDSKDW